ncbi:MAG: D,D-heptose 1,7-bisphosphate phosphatase [Desulfuromonadaceae bacterium GWC2_58_13]|nr:MAG: D,D-heptose 1,7-bisphosphate phosphatase [Desulfuromonadaceae bacterium GWC2_58_13]
MRAPHKFSLSEKTERRAVFLDRDGTINFEKDYLYRIEDFEFVEGAPEAIRQLNEAGFAVIVVTNQSGVARGYYSMEDVDCLHRYIQKKLAEAGAAIDAFYVCPHHPVFGVGEYRRDCDCRKGKPGMLLRAAVDFGLDLEKSYMVGDKLVDVEAGLAAGCTSFLVNTGYGAQEAACLPPGKTRVVKDIVEAAGAILKIG